MGKIEIDHTGSGGGITLSSDGTSLLLGGTAIGGGADLYIANPSSATDPTASGTNSIAIGSSASAAGNDAFAAATSASASDNRAIAIGLQSVASSVGAIAIGYQTNAGGSGLGGDTAIGYQAVSAGINSVSLGKAYSSGTDSFAAAIANNTSSYGATGNNSIAIGRQAKATEANSTMIGKDGIASGSRSIVLGGNSNSATQLYTAAINGSDAIADVAGKIVFGTMYAGWTSDRAPQTGLMTLFAQTTDATATELLAQTTRVSLPNNSAFAFHGTIVARQQASGGTASAAWKIEGLIRREGSAGTTTLVNSATTVLDNTPSWGMALSADTTNGGLKIEVTGAAATNIRWVATIHTSEVTYA